MMHYKKGKNVEEELTQDQIPIEALPERFLWMHVKGGSRIFNLVDYAKKELEGGQHRAMVWSGSGGGVGKTISCVEIMKKDYELHQVTRVCYRKVEEYWDPQQEGLEPIVATRNIPSIHILLSLDEIDAKTPGYQHSKTRTSFWLEGDADRVNGGGGPRKGGNYFTGPQLKKKPNRNYENVEKNGGGGASGGGGGAKNKKKNKNKSGKPPGEDGGSEDRKKGGGAAAGENKAKKAKNNENKQKAQNTGGESAPAAKEPGSGTDP